MGKPNLFIVGAAKSGTTSLHNYLNQHKDIFMCSPKEPHFLINNEIGIERIPIGITGRRSYEELFDLGKDKKYRGESSVMYLMYPELVIPKIKQEYGEESKVIIMLRNPVERAYSGFHHVKRYNVKEDCKDFQTAWNKSEIRYLENKDMTPASRYQELGMYFSQVQQYLNQLNNVHIIIYDDYKTNFQQEINKVFDFLEVERVIVNSEQKHMVGGWEWENERMKKLLMKDNPLKLIIKMILPFKSLRKKIKLKIQEVSTVNVSLILEDDKQMLQNFYREDVRKLSVLLNRNLNFWIE